MNTVILTAGRALRLGGLAPYACKSLVKINGRTVLDRQLAVLAPLSETVTVVCRTEHLDPLDGYPVRLVAHDLFDGPVGALRAAHPAGDTLVCYGDTLLRELAHGDEWVGFNYASGPRRWDVINHGRITYRWVDAHDVCQVCVGLYRFTRAELVWGPDMPAAIHNYGGLAARVVPGWADAGDQPAVRLLQETMT